MWSPTKERKMFVHGRPSRLSWIPDQQQGSRPCKGKVGSDPQAARTNKRNRIEILLIGMLNYYHRHLSNLAGLLEPLH